MKQDHFKKAPDSIWRWQSVVMTTDDKIDVKNNLLFCIH